MRSRALVVGVIVVAFVAGLLLWFGVFGQKKARPSEVPPTAPARAFTPAEAPTFGNMMARVTVTEWLDPECEGCRAMHPLFKKIVADTGAEYIL